jgi:hypothetical protein
MKAPTILGKRMRVDKLDGYSTRIGGIVCHLQTSLIGNLWWRPSLNHTWFGRAYRNQETAARALERKLIQLHAELGKRIGGEK